MIAARSFVLWSWWLVLSAVVVNIGSHSPLVVRAQTVATFEVFDNGASEGGVKVTLAESDFPNDDGAGELFAMQMSTKYVNVSKFGQEPGTVIATKAFREDGERIESFEQLLPDEGISERRVYLVAQGLEFVWPFVAPGHIQTVSPRALTSVDPERPVVIESMSDSPRVFTIHNLFSEEESKALIDHNEAKLARSTVGNSKGGGEDGARQDSGRTSENAWDSRSPTAKKMITRSFNLTGIEENAGKVDGLQVVRYTEGQFYNSHPDYFEKHVDPDFDFYPYSGGSNRFATVFMYINDVEEGGSTVFPKAPSNNPTEPPPHALAMFKKGSMEYNLLHKCHTQMAVEPKQGTAALFYSIKPDGQIDKASLHGACPVIKGTKWGANIWIWNRQRFGEIRTGDPRKLSVKNSLSEPVYITWEGRPNGILKAGESFALNSYEFHRFKARTESHGGPVVREFTVQTDPPAQSWEILPERQLKGDISNVPSQVKNSMAQAGSEL